MKRGIVVSIFVFLAFSLLLSVVMAQNICEDESSGRLMSFNPLKFIFNFLMGMSYFDDTAYLGDDTFEETLFLPGAEPDLEDRIPEPVDPTTGTGCSEPAPAGGAYIYCGENIVPPHNSAVISQEYHYVCRGGNWEEVVERVSLRGIEDCGHDSETPGLSYCGDEGHIYRDVEVSYRYCEAGMCQESYHEERRVLGLLPATKIIFISGGCISDDNYQVTERIEKPYCDSSRSPVDFSWDITTRVTSYTLPDCEESGMEGIGEEASTDAELPEDPGTEI